MRLRPRFLALAAVAAAVLPIAADQGVAGAVDQDLVASATSGEAGDVITFSSASCVDDPDAGIYRSVLVRLISGTAPDEVLAGAGAGYDGTDATIVIPDWIDPSAPAVVEAGCAELDVSGPDEVQTVADFNPIPFDVLPSVDPAVQTRTFSRTSLLAGQAFAVQGTGCTLAKATYAGTDVSVGGDLTGRTLEDFVASGWGELDGQDFDVPVGMTNSSYYFGVLVPEGGAPEIDELVEIPTDIAPGTYTAIAYCGDDEGNILVYEPQLIEVTGAAPFGDIDLTVAAGSRTATLAGGSCTAGLVSYEVLATSLADFVGSAPFSLDRPADGEAAALAIRGRRALPAAAGVHARTGSAAARFADAQAGRPRIWATGVGGEGELTPDAAGDWSRSEDVDFDDGIVEGYAWCGDPLADGFLYDPQVAGVDAAVETTTTTTTTTTPPSPPANAVPGDANFAG